MFGHIQCGLPFGGWARKEDSWPERQDIYFAAALQSGHPALPPQHSDFPKLQANLRMSLQKACGAATAKLRVPAY